MGQLDDLVDATLAVDISYQGPQLNCVTIKDIVVY